MNSTLEDSATLFAIYNSLFELNPDPCYALDKSGRFILINKTASDKTGYTNEELSEFSFLDIIKEEFKESMNELFIDVLTNKKRRSYEVSIIHKKGFTIELYGTSVPVMVGDQVIGIAGIVKDITNSNHIQRELEHTKTELESVFNSIDVCVWSTDFQHEEVFQISSACLKIYGYSQEDFIGNPNLWMEVIHPEDIAKVEKMQQKLTTGKPLKLEYRIIDANQNVKWVSNFTTPIFNETGELIRLNGVVADIHQRRIAEEQLEFMAFHDELTQLPNRRRFEKLLNKSIVKAKKANTKLAIFFYDLDQFKWINDTLGHTVGDKVLKVIAKRLKDAVGKEDIVSRMGGDEFIILLKDIKDVKQAEKMAQKVIDTTLKPIYLGKRKYVFTASMGISMFPDQANKVEKLITYADQALNSAKMDGKNTFKLYQTDYSGELSRKLEIHQALQQALGNKESMSVNYQPIIDMQTESIAGFEALLRWNDPTLGTVSPSEFIPIAEESGLIMQLGEWVIRTTCKQFSELYKNCNASPYLSINVSTRQFENESFVRKLSSILEETNFNPKLLKIELTESIMMKDVEKTIEQLKGLNDLGIEVFLDDFGTGYSSLNYLGELPISTLKIDRSFIQGIDDLGKEAIVRTIISMANSLEKGIIAEGVEKECQLLYLLNNGCHNIQGYLFSKPVPFKDIINLINKGIPGRTS